ncbi:Acid phosphatase-like protein [Pleurostoma richardsiae]|uniref:Acid phosphatase-like protein n=1 Tax=Pleurostoma richardsiae TaxID=41990 RepID=A0AA38VCY9_9PEZI|nr:Acid phosphatase-like protein [Pleurostoma richardsiae]
MGLGTAGTIIVVIIVLAAAGALGWIVFSRWRAQRLGLPPPSWTSFIPFRKSEPSYGPPQPAPGGVVGWFNDQVRKFRNRNNRTAAGAYEGGYSASGGGAAARSGRRGFGPLDPDDAWDARVGNEADAYGPHGYYEEEQELGLAPRHQQQQQDTSYGGASAAGGDGYQMNLAATPGVDEESRGRTLSRSPDPSGRGLGVPGRAGGNPFDDDAAEPSNLSLRGVSPRPIDTAPGAAATQGKDQESPTERRSVFRENV